MRNVALMESRKSFRVAHKATVMALAVSGCALGYAGPAQASPLAVTLPAIVANYGLPLCAGPSLPTVGLTAPANAAEAKSAAILGGQLSALDRIRLQQAGPEPTSSAIEAERLTPASMSSLHCTVSARTGSEVQVQQFAASVAPLANADTFLATGRVPIGRTRLTGDWQRVSTSELSPRQVDGLGWADSSASGDLLDRVNRWVNASIAYTEDSQLYSQSDYWASAQETLRRGRGDCEDIAILKYHLLAAMGFDREDMYLTLARDLSRRADHAVLIVRFGGEYFMLDNATDTVLPADQSYDYRPVLSYGASSTWLHGYTNERRFAAADYLSVSAISNPREIGLNR